MFGRFSSYQTDRGLVNSTRLGRAKIPVWNFCMVGIMVYITRPQSVCYNTCLITSNLVLPTTLLSAWCLNKNKTILPVSWLLAAILEIVLYQVIDKVHVVALISIKLAYGQLKK